MKTLIMSSSLTVYEIDQNGNAYARIIDNDNGFITVEVQGASSVLSSIEESDITAYVDLSDLKEGEHKLKVIVKGTNPLATYKAKRTEATVVISKKN